MDRKTFAFKLAETKTRNTKWKARDGVSVAGCTFVEEGNYWSSRPFVPDGVAAC